MTSGTVNMYVLTWWNKMGFSKYYLTYHRSAFQLPDLKQLGMSSRCRLCASFFTDGSSGGASWPSIEKVYFCLFVFCLSFKDDTAKVTWEFHPDSWRASSVGNNLSKLGLFLFHITYQFKTLCVCSNIFELQHQLMKW